MAFPVSKPLDLNLSLLEMLKKPRPPSVRPFMLLQRLLAREKLSAVLSIALKHCLVLLVTSLVLYPDYLVLVLILYHV